MYNFGVLVILIVIQLSIVRVNLITKEFCSSNKDYELKYLVKNYFDRNVINNTVLNLWK